MSHQGAKRLSPESDPWNGDDEEIGLRVLTSDTPRPEKYYTDM